MAENVQEEPKPPLRWKPERGAPKNRVFHVSLPLERTFEVIDGHLWCYESYRFPLSRPLPKQHPFELHRTKETDKQDWGPIDTKNGTKQALKPFVNVLHGALYAAARAAVKQARAPQGKEYYDVLPKEIVNWAEGVIRREMDGEHCVDNYRVARLGNAPQMRRYRRQQKNGCCGSYDETLEGPDGNKYMVGCNYGH